MKRFPTILCALLALAGTARASSVLKMSVRDLAQRADLVFAGTVAAVDEAMTPDLGMAYTFVSFTDLDVIAGDYAENTLTLRLDGGSLGPDMAIGIDGMPRFAEGERVVLFVVAGNGEIPCPIVGWGQGKLTVVDGENGPVVRDEFGRTIHGIHRHEFVVTGEASADEHLYVRAGMVEEKVESAREDLGAGDSDDAAVTAPVEPSVPEKLLSEKLSLETLRAAVQELRARADGNAPKAALAVRSAELSTVPASSERQSEPAPKAAGR